VVGVSATVVVGVSAAGDPFLSFLLLRATRRIALRSAT